jgi:DNA-binding HxlR family transcriptional regulator
MTVSTPKPVRDTPEVINGKWKLPIIYSSNERFTDIQESIVDQKVLAKELKDLETTSTYQKNNCFRLSLCNILQTDWRR